MRRVLMVLVALFLVNFPFVHQTLTEREITRSGRDLAVPLLESRTVNDRRLVEYRLPRSLDPRREVYSGRVDATTYARARESGELLVRVVPGKPSANRPAGEVGSHLFAVLALTCDLVLVLVSVLLWRRWRRWSWHQVLGVEDGLVTLTAHGTTLTVAGPPGWTARVRPGDRVSGSLHLVAEGDLLPGLPLSGIEQTHGASYVVHGRVRDARTGRVRLELADGFRLTVQTGPHRIRADIRDSTEARGTLCFTPTITRD